MPVANREVIRPARPDDIPRLGQLFREAFGAERPAAIWTWKYFGERPGASYVCEADDRLVAHCGGTPVRFRDGDREYPAYQSVDFMSSPSYPGGVGGGGVFVRTVRQMFADHCGPTKAQLVYGFPGERHRLVGERLLGYHALEAVHELTLDPASDSLKPEPLVAATLPIFSRTAITFGAIRDEPYLRWRYLQHPTFRYGQIIVRRRLWAGKTAAILRDLDTHFTLMEIGGSTATRNVAHLVAELQRLGKPVKGWFSPGHPLGLLLLAHGFKAAAREHSIEYRFFIDRKAPRPGELYYTLGDYDVH